MNIAAIVLAGGKGTRMKSALPKVFHKVCGKSILDRVIETLNSSGVSKIALVAGGELNNFEKYHSDKNISIVQQVNRLGTGDAVAAATLAFQGTELPSYCKSNLIFGEKINSDYVLITAADTPAISKDVIRDFIDTSIKNNASLSVVGIKLPNPFGYGRLVQDKEGKLEKIVEEKDANNEQKLIQLCNSGVILAKTELLFSLISKITNDNAQKEYYLTDCFELAKKDGESVEIYQTDEYYSFFGVNNRSQLAKAEEVILNQNRERVMAEGVSLKMPNTCYIEDEVHVGSDTTIHGNCYLAGNTTIGSDCIIEPNVVLINAKIDNGQHIEAGYREVNK